METIEQAKAHLRQGWGTTNGVPCPCCGQKVKLYARQIHSTVARELIRLYRLGDGYHHNREFKIDSAAGDFSKVIHWGLAKPKFDPDDMAKKNTGYWKMTPLGRDFVECRAEIPKYCYIFNNKLISTSDEKVGIMHTLGKKFNYAELMGYLI